MSDAAPPPWVKRLPTQVSTESIELAHAEIKRRKKVLTWAHGEAEAQELAGGMALAQAYERIAQLEDIPTDSRGADS